jgi:hypothetical protein
VKPVSVAASASRYEADTHSGRRVVGESKCRTLTNGQIRLSSVLQSSVRNTLEKFEDEELDGDGDRDDPDISDGRGLAPWFAARPPSFHPKKYTSRPEH